MFCYIKLRKKGNLNWKALREDGNILVFDRYETAKKYVDDLSDYVCKIVAMSYHPVHRRSSLYRKPYKKIGW